MTKPKALFNWSGGKDSSICLHNVLRSDEYEISFLFTTVNARYNRISQHGVRLELLEKQAQNIGIPLRKLFLPDTPTMESYNRLMKETLAEYKKEGIDVSIFGDIFLEDLRQYRENQLSEMGYRGEFPLWDQSTGELAKEFVRKGFKAVAVCIDEKCLDKSFAGREYNESFLNDLPEKVDPCGENGEFHTFVYDGPVFDQAIPVTRGQVIYRAYRGSAEQDKEQDQKALTTGFWYCDLLPG